MSFLLKLDTRGLKPCRKENYVFIIFLLKNISWNTCAMTKIFTKMVHKTVVTLMRSVKGYSQIFIILRETSVPEPLF